MTGEKEEKQEVLIYDLFRVQKREKRHLSARFTNCWIPNSIKKINTASIYNLYVQYHHIDICQSELFFNSGRNNTYLSEKLKASLQMRPDHHRTSIKVWPHCLKLHLWLLEELQRNIPQHTSRKTWMSVFQHQLCFWKKLSSYIRLKHLKQNKSPPKSAKKNP